MNYEDLVTELLQLRAKAETSAAQFLARLCETERDAMALLRENGHASFEGFLASTHLCAETRYTRFRKGWHALGSAKAVEIGEHATAEAAAFREPTPERMAALVAKAEDFVARENVAPSEQTAERWRRDLDAPPSPVPRRADRLAELEAENRKLRADLRAAQRLIAELELENEALKLGRPAARKPAKKAARATA